MAKTGLFHLPKVQEIVVSVAVAKTMANHIILKKQTLHGQTLADRTKPGPSFQL
jgi:hypothetical protein